MKAIKNKRLLTLAYIAFAQFVIDVKVDRLIRALQIINSQIGKSKTDKGIWFRFFSNDTGATTIKDLENTFNVDCPRNSQAYRNKIYYVECIGIALTEISLEMYYS